MLENFVAVLSILSTPSDCSCICLIYSYWLDLKSQYCGDDFGMSNRQSSLASRLTDSVATKFLIITRGVMDKDMFSILNWFPLLVTGENFRICSVFFRR